MGPRYPEFNRNSYEIPDNETLLYLLRHFIIFFFPSLYFVYYRLIEKCYKFRRFLGLIEDLKLIFDLKIVESRIQCREDSLFTMLVLVTYFLTTLYMFTDTTALWLWKLLEICYCYKILSV